jgi:hypothetical protein
MNAGEVQEVIRIEVRRKSFKTGMLRVRVIELRAN